MADALTIRDGFQSREELFRRPFQINEDGKEYALVCLIARKEHSGYVIQSLQAGDSVVVQIDLRADCHFFVGMPASCGQIRPFSVDGTIWVLLKSQGARTALIGATCRIPKTTRIRTDSVHWGTLTGKAHPLPGHF